MVLDHLAAVRRFEAERRLDYLRDTRLALAGDEETVSRAEEALLAMAGKEAPMGDVSDLLGRLPGKE